MINFLDTEEKRDKIYKMIEQDINDKSVAKSDLRKKMVFLLNGFKEFINLKYDTYTNERLLVNDYLQSTNILYDGASDFNDLFTVQLLVNATHGAQMDELDKDFISSISSGKRVNHSIHEDIYMPSCGSVSSYGGSHC